MNNLESSVEKPSTTSVLTENLRSQYLQAMGIQTWFDPALEIIPVPLPVPAEVESLVEHSLELLEAPPAIEGTSQTAQVVEAQQPDPQKTSPASTQFTQSVQPEVAPVYIEPSQLVSDGISTISHLNSQIEQCQLCELHTMRAQAISGEGSEEANLLILIDAPVSDVVSEVSTGNALFATADKHMLQAMLQTIGISLSSVYISSLVKCRPAEQRAPYTSEMICCDDHLSAQIKLIQPQAIMVLGEQASQQLLVSQKSLTDLRLRHHKHLGIPVYASYHPRELFSSSDTKRKVWADLLQISKHTHIN